MSPEFSLPEFLSWCRTKPVDERYNFFDYSFCAIAQFGLATGRAHLVGIGDLEDATENGILPEHLWEALADDWSTFGALVKRLEKLCPETPDYARIEAYLVDLEAVL